MIDTISPGELRWFGTWIEKDPSPPNLGFDREVLVMHPGTQWIPDRRASSARPYLHSSDDARASHQQQLIIEEALTAVVDPQARWCFALYAGFLNETDHGRSDGFHEPAASWWFGQLNFVLFAGDLADGAYSGVDQRWGSGLPYAVGAPRPIVELSYLWTEDHSVLVASPPNTAVTFVQGPDALVSRLLATSELDAHQWHR